MWVALKKLEAQKEKRKEWKAKNGKEDLSFLGQLIMSLWKRDDVEGAFRKAIILGKDVEDQVKRISRIIVNIYVAPIPILVKIEAIAKNGEKGECVAVDLVSKWIMHLLNVTHVNIEKSEKKDEKKDEINEMKGMKRLKLEDICEAAMKYCETAKKMKKGCMIAERGQGEVCIIFGSLRKYIEISISKFLSWALAQSSETIMLDKVSRFEIFNKTEMMLQKYIIETYIENKNSDLWKSIMEVSFMEMNDGIMMELEINVEYAMNSIKDNFRAFFDENYLQCMEQTMSQMLYNLQQFNEKIKRIPFERMARNLNFEKFDTEFDNVSQSQGARLIAQYLNWLQSQFYQRHNEEMKNSSQLLGRVLASYLFLGQVSEMPVKLFTQKFKKMICDLVGAYAPFFCMACSTKNKATHNSCEKCTFAQIKFLQN